MVPDPPDIIDLSAGGGSAIPAFLIITGITDPEDSERVVLPRVEDSAGKPAYYLALGGNEYEAFWAEGDWYVYVNLGNDYEATVTSEASTPVGLTGWTVVTGAGSPVINGSAPAPVSLSIAGADSPVQATLTADVSGVNNNLVFTAVPVGRLGNDIAVTITANGTNAVLSVAVTGREIVINIGTGTNAGTTANNVIAAVEASAAASALVTVVNAPGNNGTGLAVPRARAALTGGLGGLPMPPETVAI